MDNQSQNASAPLNGNRNASNGAGLLNDVQSPYQPPATSQPIPTASSPPQANPQPTFNLPPTNTPNKRKTKWLIAVIIFFVVAAVTTGIILWQNYQNKQLASSEQANVAERFGTLDIPLNDIASALLVADSSKILSINGQLKVNNTFVLTPTNQPTQGVAGQMYYDKATNQLNYFNGSSFVSLTSNPQTVTSIGGVGGAITLGGGLSLNGNQLVSQTGIVNITSASTNLTVANDGNGNVTLSTPNMLSGSGTSGRIAVFTSGQAISDSLLSQTGSSVNVDGSLAVAGAISLQSSNTVSINLAHTASGVTGQIFNDGNLHVHGGQNNVWIDAGGSGTIFLNAANSNPVAINEATIPGYPLEVNGDINITAGHSYRIDGIVICDSSGCVGGGGSGVSSLNGLTGALTLANASGAGTTITINNASTVGKGIAQFNSSNFSVSSGVVNTIQDIGTGASPTFAGVNTNSINPSAALTVGTVSQSLTLQGSSTVITSTNAGSTTTLSFVAPTASVTYRLQTAAAGTYDICTTVGNCAGIGGAVTTPGGTNNTLAKFTGSQTIGNSLITDNGTLVTVNGDLSVTGTVSLSTALSIANGGTGSTTASGARTNLGAAASGANSDITSLSGLTTALTVLQGGTGATSLTANGVLLGNGTSPISSVAAGGAGLCLISTAGAPTWQACPGGGGVTSLDGLTGALTIANSSGAGSTVTIDDASTTGKGIAQFNSSNFSVSAGNVNTIQNIGTGASPTFAGINTNSITPSAALTVGSTTQTVTVQGSNTTLTATNGANVASLTFVAPTASVTYRLQTAAAGTYDVCTTAGNCTGTGGGVTTSGGTTNKLAKFTGAQTIGDSLLTDNGTLVTVSGDLSVTGTVSLTTALSVGNGGTGATTAGGARTNLGAAASGSNSDITSLSGLTTALSVLQGGTGATSLTANGVLIGNGTSAISAVAAGGAGQCLVSTAGAPSWQACPGAGGVSSLNSLTGALTIANASGVGSTITINDASTSGKGIAQFNSSNFSVSSGVVNTIQDIGTSAAPSFGQLTLSSSQASAVMLTVDNTNVAASGNLIDLKLGGSSKFSVSPAGALTLSGTVNGQTISSTASFTGTLGVTGLASLNGGATVTGTLTANTISPTSSLTIGAVAQSFTLQGNASSTITANDGISTTSLIFQTPTANVNYRFLTTSAGTYDVCTTAGNCTGTGGGVTTPGGTTNKLAKFTGAQTIGDSIITDNGSTVTIGGTLAVNTITPSAALTVGATGQNLTLQGAVVSLTSTDSGTTNSLTFATPSGVNKTITIPNITGTICLDSGNCLGGGGGGANTSLSNLTGVAINTSLLPGAAGTIDLGSGTLTFRDLYLSGTSGTPGTNNFKITGVSTSGTRTLTLPDESGTFCTTGSVCTGYAPASGSGNYIQNQNSVDQSANWRITGVGQANTSLLAPLFDTASAVDLNVGTNNATNINLNENTTLAAGKNLTLANGTGTFSQTYTNTTGNAFTLAVTDSASSGTTTLQGVALNLTGTNNASGSNTISGISFGNVVAATNNVYYGINFGTGLTDLLRYNGTQLISGAGYIQNAAIDSSLTYSNLTKVGALDVGSITTGFGTITTANTITGTTINGTTGINTGASAGTQRIDASGNLVNIGTITTSGAINSQTISSAANFTGTVTIQGSNALTLGVTGTSTGAILFKGSTAASGTITLIGQNNPTGTQTITLPNESGTVCTTGSVCTGYAPSSGGSSYIQNQNASQQTANYWISGSGRADTSLQAPLFDTATAATLNVGTTNATSIALNKSTTLAAGQSLTVTGGNTASRPGSPTEGMVYYDTTTKALITYSNGKWQADRSTANKIVAMGSPAGCTGSVPTASANPDGADYVVNSCTSAETTINSAISALPASGGTVYLMEGTYILNGSINLPSNVTLSGAGEATTLKFKDNATTSIYMISNSDTVGGNSSITVRNLRLDGNKSNNGGNQWGVVFTKVGSGSGSTAIMGANIESATVQNFTRDGIYLISSNNNRIHNSAILSNKYHEIDTSGSENNTISNNLFKTDRAINATIEVNGNYNNVSNNVIHYDYATTYGAIYLSSSSYSNVSNNTINTTAAATEAAINVNGGARNGISGNNLNNSGLIGIKITGGVANIVSSNNIVAGQEAIKFIGGSNNTVDGNSIYIFNASSPGAINLVASGTTLHYNNSIINNYISGISGYAISIDTYGVGNLLSNNRYLVLTLSDSGRSTIYSNQLTDGRSLALTSQAGVSVGTLTTTASMTVQGAYVSSALPSPSAPTVTNQGTAGSTSYTYAISAYDGIGETLVSTGTTTTTGNATLNGSNFNRISWYTRVGGAISYKVYRTASSGTPSSTGLIGTVAAGASTTLQFDDTGIAASGSVPASNTTGGMSLAGGLQGTTAVFGSANALTLGTSSSTTGAIVFKGSGGTGSITLIGQNNPTGARTITLPDESGTVCTTGSVCSGYAPASGSANYIQNQNASQQSASNYWISGSGRADTSLQAPLFDTATAATLNVGTTNATVLNIGNGSGSTAVTISCGTGTCGLGNNATDHTTTIGSVTGTSATNIQSGTGGVSIGSNGIANTIQLGNTSGAVNQSINIGNNASGVNTLTVGSTSSTSATTLQAGTGNLNITTQGGNLNIGNNAVAQTLNIGNGTGATAVSVLCGTGTCGFGNNATAHTTTVGSNTGAATTNLQAGSGGISLTSGANITVGASDTTGTLLVLDTKTDAGDPTGVAGGMYYNSNLRVFRCYQDGYWRDCMVSARTSYEYTNDMMSNTWDSVMGNIGSTSPNNDGDTSHPGIVSAGTGADSTAWSGMVDTGFGTQIRLGNGDYWRYDTVLRLSALSTDTQRFYAAAGFTDNRPGSITDGCYLLYKDDINSGKWQGTCEDNDVVSTCDTTISVAASTWYRLTVVVNSAGTSADFQVNGVSKCQVTTNIPTASGRTTSYGDHIQKTVGTTDRWIDIDYIDFMGQFGTAR